MQTKSRPLVIDTAAGQAFTLSSTLDKIDESIRKFVANLYPVIGEFPQENRAIQIIIMEDQVFDQIPYEMITSDLFSRTHSQGVLRLIHLCTYKSQYKPSWAVEVAVFGQFSTKYLCTDLFLIAFNKFVGHIFVPLWQ